MSRSTAGPMRDFVKVEGNQETGFATWKVEAMLAARLPGDLRE